ncbi:50S ribosomal protein L7Ae [Lophiotrema nucula]|uniref:H/ACA ribonucleoprotein complex subunit 2 n=1 Tax=Lophiotrema nucula TaxID=690887 RepID=A0A6A5ZHY3_9PLEO|nr:50S ribosomal protein L7Ae [Lophiotrema nucula]
MPSSLQTAWPLAHDPLTQQLLDLVQQASHYKQVRKGANESIKALNRGMAELVVLAANAAPIAVVLPLVLLCEDKNVPWIWLGSKSALGRACGVARPVIAVCVTSNEGGELAGQIGKMKEQVERLAV